MKGHTTSFAGCQHFEGEEEVMEGGLDRNPCAVEVVAEVVLCQEVVG